IPPRPICTKIPADPNAGAWTFGHLIEQMAGSNDPSDFAMKWLQLWMNSQSLNTFGVEARTAIQTQVIAPWLAASGG
ncbi:hypothetical protein ACSTK0_24110, partial [Vibrio parahaemolyticus]